MLLKVDFARPGPQSAAMLMAIPFPDVSPNIFTLELFGFAFTLRWYAVAYIVGILIGWRIARAALKRPVLWRGDRAPMLPEDLDDLLTWVIVGIIAGGRLGYVVFYEPAYFIANPSLIPAIWTGGMSFHGGFLGVVLAIFVWSRAKGVRLWSAADTIALATPPAILLGRIANFINAELWGRETDLPWGVIFPGEAAQACATATELCARHPSQLYEAALEGLLMGAAVIWLSFRSGWLRYPGLLSGFVFTFYGTVRFGIEFLRQPDAQFVTPGNPVGLAVHLGGYGLTMGQLLSLPMILIGIALMLRARRN